MAYDAASDLPPNAMHAALENSTDCIALLSRDWTIAFLNQRAIRELADQRDLTGLSHWDAFPHLLGTETETAYRLVMADRVPRRIEVHSRRLNAWYDVAITPLPDGGLAIFFRNVSDTKTVQLALSESLTRLQLALRAGNLGIWDWDLTSNTFSYSAQARQICGFPEHDAVTYDMVVRATHPLDLPRTAALARRALDPAVRHREPYEYRIIRPHDGAVRWVVAHGHAEFDDDTGVAIRYIGTIEDITERKLAEEATQESEARLRLAIDAGRMAVWSFDVPSETLEVTPELKRVLGFPSDSSPDRDQLERGYMPGEQERVRLAAETALRRGQRFFEVEYKYRRPDDSVRWLLMRAEIELSAEAVPARVLGVVLDITDRVDADAQRQLIAEEMVHRARNAFALVTSIAQVSMQPGPERTRLLERIQALAEGYTLSLVEGEGSDLAALIRREVMPYGLERFIMSGPAVSLPRSGTVSLGLLLHELASNAAKYGALSCSQGQVHLHWQLENAVVHIVWQEHGGPPVTPPARQGFGSRLIDSVLGRGEGEVRRFFDPLGVRVEISTRLSPLSDPVENQDHQEPGVQGAVTRRPKPGHEG